MNPSFDDNVNGDFSADGDIRLFSAETAGRSGYAPEEPVQVKALAATYDRKFNLGNFESLHVGMTIWARSRLADGQTCDLHDVKERLRQMARENCRAQLLRLQGETTPVFLGLPPPAGGRFDPIYARTVSVSLCQKVNLGNYQMVAPAYTDWADLRALAGSQSELHIALERLWASLWANVTDEIRRAQGLGSRDDAYFGLPAVAVEDLARPANGQGRQDGDSRNGRPR